MYQTISSMTLLRRTAVFLKQYKVIFAVGAVEYANLSQGDVNTLIAISTPTGDFESFFGICCSLRHLPLVYGCFQ